MKLGTQTASLINHLHSRGVIGQPEPTVGMGATILGWTDRNPATIVEVFKVGNTQFIAIQPDDYKRTDNRGFSESQDYEYTPNPDAHKSYYRIGRDGKWEGVFKNADTNRWNQTGGNGLRIGSREKYHDFSF